VASPQSLDLNDVIEGVGTFLRGAIREDVSVVVELAAELPRVKVDPHSSSRC